MLWALLLAAIVVILATWVAGEIAERQERDAVDTRLSANLAAGTEEFADALRDAQAKAERIAGSPQVQRALADQDEAVAQGIVAAEGDNVALSADGRLLAGEDDWSASRTVSVLDDQKEVIGRVVVGVPLDKELADRLARASGLGEGDVLAIVENGRTLAASGMLEPGTALPTGQQGSTEQGDEAYRFVSTPLLEETDVGLTVLSSEAPVAAAVDETQRRALFAALATVGLALLAAGTIAWTQRHRVAEAQAAAEEADRGRRSSDVRRSGDEQRVREAVALVGEALAATHDPEALLPVILQSAIEATGAAGARLVSGGTEVVRAGRPEEGGGPLSLRLGTDEDGIGRLLLYPPRDGTFDEESEQLAHWLAAQASIAIENERLHRTVKRQAITDELTQLANRRRFTETLAVEVRRAERFGDPVALVLADLDDFKLINDQYGHQAGDEVLRLFADVLRENVRDFDLPVRYGGEEFAVLLPETGLDGAERLARRLQSALRRLRLPEVGGDEPPVTASFGVASFPAARGADELLSAADRALYRAKAEGKNRVALG
ncbi:MAG TPA: GGDEF domain-containing protein [Gaiellaceae bacterium]|nr:GGDEF domain-containing protein [Gaiellaceae bacterium]